MANKQRSNDEISSTILAEEIYDKALELKPSLWRKKIKNVDDRADYIFDAIVEGFSLEHNTELAGRRERVLDALYAHIYAGLT